MSMPTFEQGPIRPPSEARSLLLRVTRNCSWNKCKFCSVYKGYKFERRSVDEVKTDIDTVTDMIKTVKGVSWQMGFAGTVAPQVAQYFFERAGYGQAFLSVVNWLYYGTGAVFLQDGNNLILKAENLAEMLNYLNEKVPGITRITTYSRSRTVAKKSVDELKLVREAGLNRVHMGLESGSDRVLEFMNKGVTAEGHIRGGKNIIEAGLELSEYYMPGLGGKAMWREHALETARVLNAINPHFIRLRTLHVRSSIPLYEDVKSGAFELRTPDETVEEIRLLIENLEGITSYVASDHIGNMLQDVEGRLPGDKPGMIEALDRYLALGREERLRYQIGRVMGVYAGVPDMDDPALNQQVDEALGRLKKRYDNDLDQALVQIHDQLMR